MEWSGVESDREGTAGEGFLRRRFAAVQPAMWTAGVQESAGFSAFPAEEGPRGCCFPWRGGLRRPGKVLHAVVVLALCIHFGSLCFGQYHLQTSFLRNGYPSQYLANRVQILSPESRASNPAPTPGKPPEAWPMSPLKSLPAPASAPHHHGSSGGSAWKHHKRLPHTPSPHSSQEPDCKEVSCSEPLTATPIGCPCGCVLPLRVVVDLDGTPYLIFAHTAELELEVAAGTFLKQSQVKIMAANDNIQSSEKTRITIYLVPLGEKFDNMTAFLIYERFWQKKIPIKQPIFGDYEVLNVCYPGLPSSSSILDEWIGCVPEVSRGHEDPFTANVSPGKLQKLNAGMILVIAFSSFIVMLTCAIFITLILKWTKHGESLTSLDPAIRSSLTTRSVFRHIMSNSPENPANASLISTMATRIATVKTFSLSELEKATDHFNPKNILGEGGFGCVYHGLFEDGGEVAVKLLTRRGQNRDREFIAEIEMLSRLHHRNLVKLIGVCIDGSNRCLVYELIRNGSVESHLHGADKDKCHLDWDARMRIALGAARGLAYLHEDSNPHVIHRDFKASNVLLEEDFTPKITDFGLAREESEENRDISTRIMGTFGYVAPEYAMTGRLLVKSDVYSYGVVLLELLSGRKPVHKTQSGEMENLVTWARPFLTSREGLKQFLDPSLSGNCDVDDVAKVAAIASMCARFEPSQRPFMGEVVQALKLVCNKIDETSVDSHSQKESSSGLDYDYMEDFDAESSWWRQRGFTSSVYEHGSLFMTMECSSGPNFERQRLQPTSQLETITQHNSSGPLKAKKKSLYGLRRSISEHGCPSQHGHHVSSL